MLLGIVSPGKNADACRWGTRARLWRARIERFGGTQARTRSNEEELIERSLREMGKQLLALYDAGKALANLVCQQIVSGKTSPGNGAARIWLIYDRCGCPGSLIPFVGAADEWESDLDHRDHYEELIRKAAMKFLQRESVFTTTLKNSWSAHLVLRSSERTIGLLWFQLKKSRRG